MASKVSSEIVAPARPRKRWRLRWGRIFATLFGVLVALEIALRAIFGLGRPLLYKADADCGYVAQPNQDIVRFFHHNAINSHSMRSPEFAPSPPANTLRVLCVGDSVTYGTTYVEQEQTFPTRLAALLPDAVHTPVEVLNASAGGWAPGNELGYLKSRGTFNANVVLFIWNTPDVSQPFADFKPSLSMPTERPRTAMGETWARYVKPRLFRGNAAPPDPGSVPGGTIDASQVAANLQMLLDARELAKNAGAHFAVVFVPSPAEGWQTPAFEQDHARLASFAADNRIPLLDLTDAFRAQGWLTLSIDGIHLKPEGNEVVAREIARQWSLLKQNP
jgi:lysophospholipase L1-like esterase